MPPVRRKQAVKWIAAYLLGMNILGFVLMLGGAWLAAL